MKRRLANLTGRKNLRPARMAAYASAFVLGVAALLFAPFSTPACAQSASAPAVELRILVVAVGADDPTADAWTSPLEIEGVPFDVLRLGNGQRVTADALYGDDGHGRYQAVILTDNRVAPAGAGVSAPLPTANERALLSAYERRFGVREVLAATLPSPDLPFPLETAPATLSGTTAVVTPRGRPVFPYLVGSVPVESAAGFLPASDAGLAALVATESGRPLVAEHSSPDGRQQLYVFPRVGRTALHWRLLSHGVLTWATRGVHLGTRHFYLSMQVDDVFGVSDRWDPVAHRTVSGHVQMAASDVARALAWQRQQQLVLDLGFNGVEAKGDLCRALLDGKRSFRWFNHTYSHADLDHASQATIVKEIELNLAWAKRHGVPLASNELVTGDHQGLENPAMPVALARTGVRFIGDDASRSREQRSVGGALTVPRHPTNIYYDASTIRQQMDEYNQRYFHACPLGSGCLAGPATFEHFLDKEADAIVTHMLANDPRVHYAHQANMADDGTLYRVLDHVLARYRALVSAPIVQPTLTESGQELERQANWSKARAGGAVVATLEGCRVTVRTATDAMVPLSAQTPALPEYAGERTGWLRLAAGEHSLPLSTPSCPSGGQG